MSEVRKASNNYIIQAEAAAELMKAQRARLEELGVQFGEGMMVDTAVIPIELIETKGAQIAEALGLSELPLRTRARARKRRVK